MTSSRTNQFIEILVYTGLFFNACLAIVNAHIMSISMPIVMACEALIVLCGCGVLYRHYTPAMRKWLYFSGIFLGIWLVLMIINQTASPKAIRDILLISIFTMLGMVYQGDIFKMLTKIVIAVLLFCFIEGFLLDEIYLPLFKNALYYFNTRGIGENVGGGTELFANAYGYQGRFSLGIFNFHRLSSLFLEQVSLGLFAVVLALITMASWDNLSVSQRYFYVIAVCLILAFTNSRLGVGMIAVIMLFRVFSAIIPRYVNWFYLPLLFIGAWLLCYDPQQYRMYDTFQGRIGWTLTLLSRMDEWELLGFATQNIIRTDDSGYHYLINSYSIIGTLIFWTFISVGFPQITTIQKRYFQGLSLFLGIAFFLGAATFSIKTAALMWFFAGYIAQNHLAKQQTIL